MADISTEIQAIQTAMRGEEVRDSIIDAFEKVNTNLPTPSTMDSGKALVVSETGEWELGTIASGLPTPSALDAGKFLVVDQSGGWTLASIANAEGVSF